MKHAVVPTDIMQALKEGSDDTVPKSTVQSPEDKAETPAPGKRGGFTKGKSGNPKGRPKGALGKSTLIKQAIMAETEGLLLDNAPKVIRTVIEQAKGGCLQSQKLIWQSIIPAKRAVEISAKDDGPAVIKINIQTLDTPEVTAELEQPAIDAEFTEEE